MEQVFLDLPVLVRFKWLFKFPFLTDRTEHLDLPPVCILNSPSSFLSFPSSSPVHAEPQRFYILHL